MNYKNIEDKRKHRREYYKKNREKVLAINKKSDLKHRERNREVSKRYYENHKAECYARNQKIRKRLNAEIEAMLGYTCCVCGKICGKIAIAYKNQKRRTIHYHEIHGKTHRPSNLHYILNHIEDFIPICSKCHKVLHRLHNLGNKREKLYSLLKEMEK